LISPLPTGTAQMRVKWRFRRVLPVGMTMMEGSFGGASIAAIVLYMMVKKNRYSYQQLTCCIRSQSSLPIRRKPRLFRTFWTFESHNQVEGRTFRRSSQQIDCTRDINRGEQAFTCNPSLSRFFYTAAYR